MTDEQIAKKAASRWGQRGPTFDDVIAEHTPKYGECPHQTERWHRIAALAYDMVVTVPTCEHCGNDIIGRQGGARYCSKACGSRHNQERECAAPGCYRHLQRRDGESPKDFQRRKTCGRACGAKLGNVSRQDEA